MTLQTPINPQVNNHNRSIHISRQQDNETRIAELMALQRIGRELNSTLDENQILNLLIQEVVNTTPATHGSILLLDTQEGTHYPRVWYGYTEQELENLKNIGRLSQRGVIHRVFTTGEIAVIDDVRQEQEYIQVVSSTRSELTAPIRYGPEIVGVIDLESPELEAFDLDSQRFVLAIAEQAAIAIGNARRYAEQVDREVAVSRRNEQLRNLVEISRTLRTEHTLDDVLDLIAQTIPVAAGFNIALLSLVTGDDPPLLRRVAAAGIPLPEFNEIQQLLQPLSLLQNVMQEQYRISQSFFFPHQKRDEWDDGVYTHSILQESESWQEGKWHPNDMLLVPLRDSKRQILGILSVDDPQNGCVPTHETIETLELFANEAATAIENARLLNKTQQHIAELEQLRQVGLQVASSLDVTTILDTIVTSALHFVPADDVRIYLYHQKTQEFDCSIHRAGNSTLSRPMRPPRKDGFTAQVAKNAKMVVINDATEHPLYTRTDSKDWGIHAIAGLPLKRADQVLGVMDVSFFRKHTFTPDELRLLSMLANQAAVALDNARLYENARRRATHLEALWHINQRFASILDFDELLNQSVEIIKSYMDYNDISVYLADRDQNKLVQKARSGDAIELLDGECTISLDRPNCIITTVAKQGTPLLVTDTAQEPAYSPIDDCPARSELAVPLYIGDAVAGVLDIRSYQANVLTHEDLSTIQSLGAQLSVAFERARLYDELELRVQKRTEELADALRRQAIEADKTKAIVESISDAVIVFDPEGQIALANPATKRILGLPARQIVGQTLDQGEIADTSAHEQEMIKAVFEIARAARETLNQDQDLVHQIFEAAEKVIAASFASVMLREGEPSNVVAVFRDITREAQLDRMKSEFISMAAHEMRTPMTSVKGYADLLAAGVPGAVNEKQEMFLRIIKSNTERLMTLVNDLLDISKIESEGLRLHFESVSLADVVAEVVLALEKQIEQKEQKLNIDVPTNLPEINADRDRMIQVVTNLLSNAHKYTPSGGTISVFGKKIDSRLQIEFQDTGIGISPQDQERLFTRFFRADNAIQTQQGGTGLGLAICREIIERHEGHIEVESILGQGTTFRVLLPIQASMAPSNSNNLYHYTYK